MPSPRYYLYPSHGAEARSFVALTPGCFQNSAPTSSGQDRPAFGTGLLVLLIAQILSAIMGLYTEEIYKVYGPQWRENLFYCHALSLPLFLPFAGSLMAQFGRLSQSPPMRCPPVASAWIPAALERVLSATTRMPNKLIYLAANVLTQFACIRGVNLLAAATSALTVTIVLNIRKLVSLLLSIWLFGNQLAVGTLIGALVVFGAGALYSLDSRPHSTNAPGGVSARDKQRLD